MAVVTAEAAAAADEDASASASQSLMASIASRERRRAARSSSTCPSSANRSHSCSSASRSARSALSHKTSSSSPSTSSSSIDRSQRERTGGRVQGGGVSGACFVVCLRREKACIKQHHGCVQRRTTAPEQDRNHCISTAHNPPWARCRRRSSTPGSAYLALARRWIALVGVPWPPPPTAPPSACYSGPRMRRGSGVQRHASEVRGRGESWPRGGGQATETCCCWNRCIRSLSKHVKRRDEKQGDGSRKHPFWRQTSAVSTDR